MSTATFGEPFVTVQASDSQMEDEVYVGLYVCSHNPKVSEEAVFTNVRIVVPSPVGFKRHLEAA